MHGGVEVAKLFPDEGEGRTLAALTGNMLEVRAFGITFQGNLVAMWGKMWRPEGIPYCANTN